MVAVDAATDVLAFRQVGNKQGLQEHERSREIGDDGRYSTPAIWDPE